MRESEGVRECVSGDVNDECLVRGLTLLRVLRIQL
jgi:hypothetical protein